MIMEQVSANCYAVLNKRNLVCDANSGLINHCGSVGISRQSDLPHGRRVITLFGVIYKEAKARRIALEF